MRVMKLAEEAWRSADGLEKAKDAAAILAKELADLQDKPRL
jgi:hypothetical protein